MGRYRKRPVEVDARQFTADTMHDVLAWIREQGGTATEATADNRPVLYIHTLEGNMQACPGDWIVQGVRGEFHPVRGDIFTETYEAATVAPAAADRLALRDRIAAAMARADGWEWAAANFTKLSTPAVDRYRRCAEAVLEVLPSGGWGAGACICGHPGQQHFEDACLACDCGDFLVPEAAREVIARWREAATRKTADRGTVLREAADLAEAQRQFERCTGPRRAAQTSENVGILRVAGELRGLAGEEQQPETQARRPFVRWYVERHDHDGWVPASSPTRPRARAVQDLSERSAEQPDREFRLARATITHTVEPAVVAGPGKEG